MWAAALLIGLIPALMNTAETLAEVATGPLRVSQCNPRYFINGKGQIVYLTGSHTWTTFQDQAPHPPFDFDGYLTLLKKYGHNFMKLWMLESASWESSKGELLHRDPLPYQRVGKDKARDGLPKFDLSRFHQPYFDRLRERAMAARNKGIYAAVMLFNGWSIEGKGIDRRNWLQRMIARVYYAIGVEPPPWDRTNPWHSHPFNRANNVNGIDGDSNHDGEGLETHTLRNQDVTALQERYVEKVIDTLNDLDNVLYEISNESQGESTEWQYHMIHFIHEYENTKPMQHPVLMSWQYPGGMNEPLYESPAESVSPGSDPRDATYRTNLPASDGHKVIISDTDHIWGLGGDPEWVWRSLLRGHNPIFMEHLAEVTHDARGDIPETESIRKAMGQTRRIADKINLAGMIPRNDFCSTTYCLAHDDSEYLMYLPTGGTVSAFLGNSAGVFTVEWFNPADGVAIAGGTVHGGRQEFRAPFEGGAVVHVKTVRRAQHSTVCGRPQA